MKELHENQIIAGKAAGEQDFHPGQRCGCLKPSHSHQVSGKQIVYHAIQDPSDAMSLEDLAAMDAEIATLRETIATGKANEKLLRASLVSVNATMSSEELRDTVAQLECEKKEILARLGPLRAGNVKPVLPQEKEAVQTEWREWSKKAEVRKKICMELWEMCTEVIEEGKTKEELWVRRVLGSEELHRFANVF